MTIVAGRALFEANLRLIEELLKWIGARNFRPEDAEDFRSWACLKLIENDFAKLAQFEGRNGSQLKTFLTACLVHLAQDYRDHLLGRWRPSSEAERLGKAAVALERLINRDGLTESEAKATLLPRVEESLDELERLITRLPARSPHRRQVDDAVLGNMAAVVEEPNLERERVEALQQVVKRAIFDLPAQERLILKLRFKDGLKTVEIARLLRFDKESEHLLYRDFVKLFKILLQAVTDAGFSKDDINAILGWRGLDLGLDEIGEERE
jgi:RNA polymerase sigma factor (sigma-70 family)